MMLPFKTSVYKNGFKYVIKRSDRKSMSLCIYPDRRVVLRLPRWSTSTEINFFLDSKEKWVEEKLKKLKERASPVQIKDGHTFYILGQKKKVRILSSRGEDVLVGKKQLSIFSQQPDTDTHNEKIFEKWMREEAKTLFSQRLEHCYKLFPRDYHPIPTLKVKKVRSRWGSLSSRGNMNLNIELLRFSQKYIDFVIVHELCHLDQMNHGPKFYALMDKVMPTHRQLDQEMKRWAMIVF